MSMIYSLLYLIVIYNYVCICLIGVSMLVMGVGYHYIDQDVPVEGKKHRNKAKKQLLSYGMKVS